MKTLLGITLLAVGAVSGVSRAAPPGTGWQLILEDQFDGAALDPALWNISTGARRNAINTPSAIGVSGGQLTITTYTSGGTHYTGFIGTSGKFLSTFGYWEARIKFTSAPGMWSAFWMQSPTMGNPIGNPNVAGAEIDIVEHRIRDAAGADIRNKAAHNVHWDGYGASHKSVGALTNNPGGTSLQGNFHTYGLLWTPTTYTFYIDGVQRWSTTQGMSHRSEFIYLTSEVQNNSWAGPIPTGGYGSLSTSTTKMVVDWVRVWRRPLYGTDIGGPPLAGSDALDAAGTWTVRGSGDTWGTSDRCRYVYLPMTGDGWIFAQMSGMDHLAPHAKAGVMMRESLASNAKNVHFFLKAGGTVGFETRGATGGATASRASWPDIAAPYGLWLERFGDFFNAWGTSDYVTWDFLWSEELPMAAKIYIGLAVTNHNSSTQLNTAWFDYVQTSLD